MSLYKNRIPGDSVSFSEKAFVFEYEDLNEQIENEKRVGQKRELEQKLQEKETELIKKEEMIIEKEKQLAEKERELQKKVEDFSFQKQDFFEYMEEEKILFERQKLKDYYEMKMFFWDKAIELTEEMLNQTIASDQFKMNDLFIGMLKKLPISFDELEITIHPETEALLDMNAKNSFVLKDIRWKYNYSMDIGDFLIEDEKEFFEVKFEELFERIKKNIKTNLEKEKGEKND